MRPSVRAREERKWVVDTVNKYFDVIVEDEEGDSERSSDEGKAMSWIYQEGCAQYVHGTHARGWVKRAQNIILTYSTAREGGIKISNI